MLLMCEYVYSCPALKGLMEKLIGRERGRKGKKGEGEEEEVEWKRHLFESVHIFSVEDLMGVRKGTLEGVLEGVVREVERHMGGCGGCRGRGFWCGWCGGGEVLFSFQFEKIGRCGECGGVFHKGCWEEMRRERRKKGGRRCPVCERKRRVREMRAKEERGRGGGREEIGFLGSR